MRRYPGGGAFALFFHPHPREFATQNKKSANARGLARGGGGWAQLELTDALQLNEQQWTLLWATYEASLGTYWTLLRTWSYKHQDRTQNKAGLLYFCKIHPKCRASAGPVSRNISSITICVWLWVRESGNREYYGKQMTGDCIY